jgi:heme/copper-type cytochrome/quinol oxidase subunit 4
MELIINSGYYNEIVKVYTGTIAEFILVSFGLYLFWLSIDNVKDPIIQTKIVLSAVFLTAAPVSRSLWVLFSIIGLEKYNRT